MRLYQKNIFLLILLNSIGLLACAQYNETIRADRPGQGISAFTVGTGIFQVQSGCNIFGTSNSANGIKTNGFLNNTVVRYGITEQFELNYQFDYQTQSVTQNDVKTVQKGVDAMDLGMRYHIYTGKGLAPSVAFQFATRLPILGKDYVIKDLAPRFSIVTTQHLTKEIALTTVSGASWNGNNSVAQGNYVANISFPLFARIGGYVENYGNLQNGVFSTYFDGGFAWLVTNDLQLGLYGGYASNKGVNSFFVSSGISWRTKRRSASKG